MFGVVLLLLVFAAFALIVIFGLRSDKRDFSDFETRFPPITDEQYLALFPAGTNPEVALKVRRMVADQFMVPSAQIYPSSRFYEDLGAD